MKQTLRSLLKGSLKYLDIEVTTQSYIQSLVEYENDIISLLKLPKNDLVRVLELYDKSKSQLKQDLFVLSEVNFKKNGFFVEFGATNGIDFSNSYILEKEFNWNGILAEPAKCWHSSLRKNRSSHIETNCVWGNSDSVLTFKEVESPELSTIKAYSSVDFFHNRRKRGRIYNINTISLTDLLDKYNAPKKVDYLSIDTEGSEYEILRNFDFSKYQFSVITCEHNFTPMREKIYKLLLEKGYIRKYIGLSKFDDWYIKAK
jgi:FkbM family methyltransferase